MMKRFLEISQIFLPFFLFLPIFNAFFLFPSRFCDSKTTKGKYRVAKEESNTDEEIKKRNITIKTYSFGEFQKKHWPVSYTI
jgi:hypothetical protein